MAEFCLEIYVIAIFKTLPLNFNQIAIVSLYYWHCAFESLSQHQFCVSNSTWLTGIFCVCHDWSGKHSFYVQAVKVYLLCS